MFSINNNTYLITKYINFYYPADGVLGRLLQEVWGCRPTFPNNNADTILGKKNFLKIRSEPIPTYIIDKRGGGGRGDKSMSLKTIKSNVLICCDIGSIYMYIFSVYP